MAAQIKESLSHLAEVFSLRSAQYRPSPSLSSVESGESILERGHSGHDVERLQRMLNATGIAIRQDGLFGPTTESALRAFQQGNGLSPSGMLDDASLMMFRMSFLRRSMDSRPGHPDGCCQPNDRIAQQPEGLILESRRRARIKHGPSPARLATCALNNLSEDAVAPRTYPRKKKRKNLSWDDVASSTGLPDRVLSAAERNAGYDSRTNAPAQCVNGTHAGAWAVNQIIAAAAITPLCGTRAKPGYSLERTAKQLDALTRRGYARRISVSCETQQLPPGSIICTNDGGQGHIGIVGRDGRTIHSNASRRGQWEPNYASPRHWYSMFNTNEHQPSGIEGRGLEVATYAYELLEDAGRQAL